MDKSVRFGERPSVLDLACYRLLVAIEAAML